MSTTALIKGKMPVFILQCIHFLQQHIAWDPNRTREKTVFQDFSQLCDSLWGK